MSTLGWLRRPRPSLTHENSAFSSCSKMLFCQKEHSYVIQRVLTSSFTWLEQVPASLAALDPAQPPCTVILLLKKGHTSFYWCRLSLSTVPLTQCWRLGFSLLNCPESLLFKSAVSLCWGEKRRCFQAPKCVRMATGILLSR